MEDAGTFLGLFLPTGWFQTNKPWEGMVHRTHQSGEVAPWETESVISEQPTERHDSSSASSGDEVVPDDIFEDTFGEEVKAPRSKKPEEKTQEVDRNRQRYTGPRRSKIWSFPEEDEYKEETKSSSDESSGIEETKTPESGDVDILSDEETISHKKNSLFSTSLPVPPPPPVDADEFPGDIVEEKRQISPSSYAAMEIHGFFGLIDDGSDAAGRMLIVHIPKWIRGYFMDIRDGDDIHVVHVSGKSGGVLHVLATGRHRYYSPGQRVTTCTICVPEEQWERVSPTI
jgi:hypothetical protein